MIIELAGRSCYGRSGSAVLEFGFKLVYIYVCYNIYMYVCYIHMYTFFFFLSITARGGP